MDHKSTGYAVKLLELDFHYINYTFCKEHAFSNEKISTLLAILDHVLHKMLERQLTTDAGYQLLKTHLRDHGMQRPPHSILIFSIEEVAAILTFSLQTFLRHFCLYEFAFKPRVELILKTQPAVGTVFNAQLTSLKEMVPVDGEEANRIKAMLGEKKIESTHGSQHAGPKSRENDHGNMGPSTIVSYQNSVQEQVLGEEPPSSVGADDGVDWTKVGRVYQPDMELSTVIESEVARLNRSIEAKLQIQDERLNSGITPKPK